MLSHQELLDAVPQALQSIDLPDLGPKRTGKVRDIYERGDTQILITTDRVSGFDRVLGTIPFKGQVLNQLSAWWFEQTRYIIGNHMRSMPDPNVLLARRAEPLLVEVVVRGYITGVTSTSLWTLYKQGERQPYGIVLPEGMRKNDRLPAPVITPTTKATDGTHDQQLTSAAVVERGLVPADLWQQIETAALALFTRGQSLAARAGFILVDTKYEFGLINGQLVLIDELHTPDSSRFWTIESYGTADEPENFDKEYLRRWFVDQGYRGDGPPPAIPAEIAANTAARYIDVYERLTGASFVPGVQPVAERITRHMNAVQYK